MLCLNISYIDTIHVGVHYRNRDAAICSYVWVLFWSRSSLFYLYSHLISLWSSRVYVSSVWFSYVIVIINRAAIFDDFVRDRNAPRLERILTMVYVVQNSQNFSGLFPSSCIPKKTRRFGNWICFRPQLKVGEKTPTQLGPLESDRD
jgi:hypothetical protein